MKNILIILLFMTNVIISGTLKGVVLSKQRNEPLEYVEVILEGSNLETLTDSSGNFTINNIPDGNYVLTIPTMLHERYKRNISFNSENNNHELKIVLEEVVPHIPRDSIIEKYHKELALTSSDDLLKIKIDSVGIRGAIIKVYSTFENLSSYPIYVLRSIDCINSCKIQIYKDKKKITPEIVRRSDCVGMKTHPDSTDFLKILPNSKIQYPVVKLIHVIPNENLNNYKIELIYNYNRPKIIFGPRFTAGAESFLNTYKNVFYYYNMAFRGNVKSEKISFNN